ARDALLAIQRLAGNRATLAALHDEGLDPGTLDGIGAQIRDAPRGEPMSEPVREAAEAGLGEDLSDVRPHHDRVARDLSRSVQAPAFTAGSDIFFRQGAFQPDSRAGMHTLMHEIAHTRQQARGAVQGSRVGDVTISDPGDADESAADRMADLVMGRADSPA